MKTPLIITLAAILLARALVAQTTVYLRSSAPAATQVSSVTGGTPSTVNTRTAHGHSIGDLVIIGGVCTDSGASAANGVRKVKTVPTSTSYTITDVSNADVTTGSSIDCDPVNGQPGAMWEGKATAYTLGPQPLGFLDGLNGTMYRKLALGTQNGLTSIVVSANVATVTTSYSNGMTTGDKVSVWNTTSTALNNNTPLTGDATPYTVTVTDATHFTFPTSGVGNGTYTTNATCGPSATPNDVRGGTDNCVRLSQLAYTGNAWWDAIVLYDIIQGYNSGTAYKTYFAGGTSNYPTEQWVNNYVTAAVRFLVDQKNDQMLSICVYAMTDLLKTGMVNWFVYPPYGNAGNNDISQGAGSLTYGMMWVYNAAGPYLSTAHLSTLRDMIYDDIDDPGVTPASTADADVTQSGHREVLVGPTTAQSGTATSITLNAGDSAPTGFYVNNIVWATVAGSPSYGLVTAYNASTKAATCSGGWSAGIPGAGTLYSIYATVIIASTAQLATTTITGYNTHFTAKLHVGDAIVDSTNWSTTPYAVMSYITAITDDTHLAVINSVSVNFVASTTTPQIPWYLPQWKSGDAGLLWAGKHWLSGIGGAQPLLYPSDGGSATAVAGRSGQIQEGSNNRPIQGGGS